MDAERGREIGQMLVEQKKGCNFYSLKSTATFILVSINVGTSDVKCICFCWEL